MEKKKKVLATLLVILCASFIWGINCRAWGPPKEENTEAFLKWYEENKNSGQVVYHLQGDLKLTGGSGEEPIKLDGTGAVTIDCGMHGILIDSEVIIDNPNLIIQGENYFLFMIRYDGVLNLEQGNIRSTAADGVVIQVTSNGILHTPSRQNKVTISGQGMNVIGIQHDMLNELCKISNLNISLEGSRSARGISSTFPSSLLIENCVIEVVGASETYGIYSENSADISVFNSHIVAKGEGDISRSIYTQNGRVQCENSIIYPNLTGGNTYRIIDIETQKPVYVDEETQKDKWELPKRMNTIVYDAESGEEKTISMPITWELPETEIQRPGYCIVLGKFLTEEFKEDIVNPDGVKPRITVLLLPPEKMFLIAYQTFADEELNGVQLLVPHPYGASGMEIEYSTDGKSFSIYTDKYGRTNVLGDSVREDGLCSFYVDVPVKGRTGYIRIIVKGESMFSGISPIWEIDGNKRECFPDGAWDDGSGDRGGQEIKPDLPDIDDEPVLETPDQTLEDEMIKQDADGRQFVTHKKRFSPEPIEPSDASVQYEATVPAEVRDAISDNGSEEYGRERLLTGALAGVAGLLIVVGGVWCGRSIFKKYQ